MSRAHRVVALATLLAMTSLASLAPSGQAGHINNETIDQAMHDYVYQPVNDTADAVCTTIPGGEEGLTCLLARDVQGAVYCGIPIVEDGINTGIWLITYIVNNIYPIIKEMKCNASQGVEDDINWWNEDMYEWWRGWYCFALMGGSGGDGHCATYGGATDPLACLPWYQGIDCPKPELLPETPPYP